MLGNFGSVDSMCPGNHVHITRTTHTFCVLVNHNSNMSLIIRIIRIELVCVGD